MNSHCPFVAAVTTAWIFAGWSVLGAQATGSVDVGGSWVDYEGFLGSGAMFVSPALRYDAPNTTLGASGSYVVFESGRHIVQGLAAGAWRADLGDRLRGEVSGSAGMNVYDNNPGYGHLLGRTRLHLLSKLSGAWLGMATGQSFQGSSSIAPFEVELGGWTVQRSLAFGAIATRAWASGVEYSDLVGTARWRDEFLEIDGSLGVRGWSDGGGEGFYGEMHARIPIWKRISALVSGGRYPSDRVRGVIAANYVSVSLRVDAFSASTSAPPTALRALLHELERPGKPAAGEARLTVEASLPDLYSLRVDAPDARSVELTADFTDWQPIRLRRTDRNTWEATIRIASGVHRVNVRLDGGRWIVPLGLREEQDDFGGSVGVLVVR